MIRLIAAIDQKNGIAKNGRMPWNIPDDLAYFRSQTTTHGGNVLMGYGTYQTINHSLVNRTSYVLSHRAVANLPKGVLLVNDVESFLTNFKGDLWVMGGARTYALTLPYAQELYLTKIEHDFKCDQFFPNYEQNFELLNSDGPHQQNGLRFNYLIFKRKKLGQF